MNMYLTCGGKIHIMSFICIKRLNSNLHISHRVLHEGLEFNPVKYIIYNFDIYFHTEVSSLLTPSSPSNT